MPSMAAHPIAPTLITRVCRAVKGMTWSGCFSTACSVRQKDMANERGCRMVHRSFQEGLAPSPSSRNATPQTARMAANHDFLSTIRPSVIISKGQTTMVRLQMKAAVDASAVFRPIPCPRYPRASQRPISIPGQMASFRSPLRSGMSTTPARENRRAATSEGSRVCSNSEMVGKLLPHRQAMMRKRILAVHSDMGCLETSVS
mmetsp:Transcript_22921/g.56562  ORF Transcript_22921/g.56562 Transcript_22921/m.56562 type:complete len:202 (-) Transcript_22921:491-1096(-)